MSSIKLYSTVEPKKSMSYEKWCARYKVGSRASTSVIPIDNFETPKENPFNYLLDEKNLDKFKNLINQYDQTEVRRSLSNSPIKKIFTLCKGEVQKTWYNIITKKS